jgi:hypothetical protein
VLAGGFLQDHRDTTTQLLDQAEFAEHATDHAITQAADPAREIIEAQARQRPFAWCKTFGPNALIRG